MENIERANRRFHFNRAIIKLRRAMEEYVTKRNEMHPRDIADVVLVEPSASMEVMKEQMQVFHDGISAPDFFDQIQWTDAEKGMRCGH